MLSNMLKIIQLVSGAAKQDPVPGNKHYPKRVRKRDWRSSKVLY